MIRTVAVGAVALFSVAAGMGPAAGVDDQPMTTITINVAGCEGCTVSAWTPPPALPDPDGGGPSATAKVRDGMATLRLPTAATTGTSFQIDPVKDPLMNAVTLIVFQYRGAEPGARVTKAQAKTYRRGSACWAGTSEPAVEFRVRVRRVWGPAFDPLAKNPPKRALQPLAWVVPTQQSAPPYWPLFKGALQVQNNPECRFR